MSTDRSVGNHDPIPIQHTQKMKNYRNSFNLIESMVKLLYDKLESTTEFSLKSQIQNFNHYASLKIKCNKN